MSNKNNKLVVGGVYRFFTFNTGTKKKSGYYADVLCTNVNGTATILSIAPDVNVKYSDGDWFVGGKTNIEKTSVTLVANTMEEYDYKPPVIEKIVEKVVEKTIEVEKVVILREQYKETLIDSLYNWYCRNRDKYYNDINNELV